jgi:hypothetical protein
MGQTNANVVTIDAAASLAHETNKKRLAAVYGVSERTIGRRLADGWTPGNPLPPPTPRIQKTERHQEEPTGADSAEPRAVLPFSSYGLGRGLVGLALVAAGVAITLASMAANGWYGASLTTSTTAAGIFSTLTVVAEGIAATMPSALRFLRDMHEHGWVWLGRAVLAISVTVVALASSGFVITNVSDATAIRADRMTPAVASAQTALEDAKGARDRECTKVGPICRQREDMVSQRQAELDRAKAEVKADADPQAAALYLTSSELRTIKAAVMVALCLAAGLIIGIGNVLLFPGNTNIERVTAAMPAPKSTED